MDQYQSLLIYLQNWGISEQQVLAYGSTLLISIAPFLILFLFRVENKPQHRNKLRLALSFASGGLLGDAFLHLIPHSMGHADHGHSHEHSHDHEHHHDHSGHDHHHHHEHEESHEHGHNHVHQTNVGLYIVLGIVLFFVIEKFVHILKGEAGHSHSHGHFDKKEKLSDTETSDLDDKKSRKRTKKQTRKQTKASKSANVSQTRIVSGILNLIADFLHNFTDGLAIGATFAAGKGMGSITAFTILLHEIPHEIGDYAILIQAGYRRKSALLLQLVTAIGALIGTAVGLHYGTLEHATQLILPITAGGFVYIATVSVIPELLEKTTHKQSLCEIISLFAGIAMMYWIALNE